MKQVEKVGDAFIIGHYFEGRKLVATLSDGRIIEALQYTETPAGFKAKLGDTWFVEKGVK